MMSDDWRDYIEDQNQYTDYDPDEEEPIQSFLILEETIESSLSACKVEKQGEVKA